MTERNFTVLEMRGLLVVFGRGRGRVSPGT